MRLDGRGAARPEVLPCGPCPAPAPPRPQAAHALPWPPTRHVQDLPHAAHDALQRLRQLRRGLRPPLPLVRGPSLPRPRLWLPALCLRRRSRVPRLCACCAGLAPASASATTASSASSCSPRRSSRCTASSRRSGRCGAPPARGEGGTEKLGIFRFGPKVQEYENAGADCTRRGLLERAAAEALGRVRAPLCRAAPRRAACADALRRRRMFCACYGCLFSLFIEVLAACHCCLVCKGVTTKEWVRLHVRSSCAAVPLTAPPPPPAQYDLCPESPCDGGPFEQGICFAILCTMCLAFDKSELGARPTRPAPSGPPEPCPARAQTGTSRAAMTRAMAACRAANAAAAAAGCSRGGCPHGTHPPALAPSPANPTPRLRRTWRFTDTWADVAWPQPFPAQLQARVPAAPVQRRAPPSPARPREAKRGAPVAAAYRVDRQREAGAAVAHSMERGASV